MTVGQIKDAERRALTVFDKWNDVTGFAQVGSSWYYELQSVIEDAVHIGVQMALYGKVNLNDEGEVVREKTKI